MWNIQVRSDDYSATCERLRKLGCWITQVEESYHSRMTSGVVKVHFRLPDWLQTAVDSPYPPERDAALAYASRLVALHGDWVPEQEAELQHLMAMRQNGMVSIDQARANLAVVRSSFDPGAIEIRAPGTVGSHFDPSPVCGTARAIDAPRDAGLIQAKPRKPPKPQPTYEELREAYIRDGGIRAKEKMLAKVTLSVKPDGTHVWLPDPAVSLYDPPSPYTDRLATAGGNIHEAVRRMKEPVPVPMKFRHPSWPVSAFVALFCLTIMCLLLADGYLRGLLELLVIVPNAWLAWRYSRRVPR